MVLEEAGIPHKTVRRQDHLFNLKNFPAFQMGVPFSLFEKAETAVQDAYATDASGADAVPSRNPAEVIADRSSVIQGLPETLTPSEEENMPGPPDVGDEAQWKFAHGGVEVWSGEDPAGGTCSSDLCGKTRFVSTARPHIGSNRCWFLRASSQKPGKS